MNGAPLGAPAATAPLADAIVSLSDLGKRFPLRRTWAEILRRPLRVQRVAALEDVTLEVRPGEFFGLLGPNGAGKTTLFKILATLVVPDSGRASVATHDVVTGAASVRAVLTPVIADERSLYWRISAFENLRLFAGLYGLRGADMARRVDEVLGVVGLADAGPKLVGMFSSGMKQRLLIARALLARPRVLLLDEPTRSLDPVSARDFRRFLREEIAGRQGCTVLLATHDTDEAFELCDRVGILHRGRLLAVGTVESLEARFAEERYRLVARGGARAALGALERAGRVHRLEEHEEEDGWIRFEMQLAGGRSAAADALAEVTRSGAEVASFEQIGLTLAELIERVVEGFDDAS